MAVMIGKRQKLPLSAAIAEHKRSVVLGGATTFGGEPCLTACFRQFAHAQDVGLSFGN